MTAARFAKREAEELNARSLRLRLDGTWNWRLQQQP